MRLPGLFALLLVALDGAASPLAAQTVGPTVATHFFYWYHWPTEHFDQPGAPGREGHARHFVAPEKVSYRSVDWHAGNFEAMAAAGIDFALPVYWGAPGAYERPNLAFSRVGLSPMVRALDRLEKEGDGSVRLGLFYDTSTLRNDVCGREPRGGRADLTTAAGRELFCTTVTDYFAAIPRRHWARHRGGALVVLYVSGFAERWDRELGDALRERFAARFDGDRVCLVADHSWGDIGQDLTTSWGAALWGPKLFPGVAQIGPGYDDRPVPGRRTPIREREGGRYYSWSWQRAIAHCPELVLLETWNEMHEGTELCPTIETGRQYVELTRLWIAALRTGTKPDLGPDQIELTWPEPRPRPDRSWGQAAADRDHVLVSYGDRRLGLREVACEDGPCRVEDGALRPGVVARGLGNYLYFQVSDHFAFDVDADFELEVVRRGGVPVGLEFDSRDREATLSGAYTACRPSETERQDDRVVERYLLRRARFANRQNGGADFRFVLPQRRAAILSLTLRRAR